MCVHWISSSPIVSPITRPQFLCVIFRQISVCQNSNGRREGLFSLSDEKTTQKKTLMKFRGEHSFSYNRGRCADGKGFGAPARIFHPRFLSKQRNREAP